MATNRINVIDILTPTENADIEQFCKENVGVRSLPALAAFLNKRFALSLVLDTDVVLGFSADSSNLPGEAHALCRPKTERECAIIMTACNRAAIPCTLSAGRSNLTGSATPKGGVIISAVQMLEPSPAVDIGSETVRAPVGIILEDLRKQVIELSHNRYYFPVDPTSRADATIGGVLSCNASGFTPGEPGAVRNWVASIDFILPNGKKIIAARGQYISEAGIFELAAPDKTINMPVPRYARPRIKNAGGPWSAPDGKMDFVDLVVGSEGLFGLITACTLRLDPKPDAYLDIFFSLPSEDNAVAFYHYIKKRLNNNLGSLTALEYFGVNCRKYMNHEERFFLGDDQVAIYIQVPLSDVAVDDAAAEWFGIISESNCGIDEDRIILIDNEKDRALFMDARHSMPANSLEVVQHRGTFTIMTDAVVPPDKFAEFLHYTHALLFAEKLDYLSFGHLGDCHLHFTILPEKSQLTRGAEVYRDIIAKSAQLGGVYSGEHGTGKRKRADFLTCYGAAAAEQLKKCKAAIDPGFLLNNGNVIEMGV